MLLCHFIKAFKASFPHNEEEIFESVRPYLNEHQTSILAIQNDQHRSDLELRPAPLALLNNRYLGNPRKCCCSIQQCSSTMRRPALAARRSKMHVTRQKTFCIFLGVLNFLNFFQLIHTTVLMKYFKLINISQDTVTHFIMVSFVDLGLLVCFIPYLVIVWYKRIGQPTWNQSFATILQCFLLSCSLVEIIQSVLTKSYVSDYEAGMTSFFENGIAKYNHGERSGMQRNVRQEWKGVDWIQREFGCCGYSMNATEDWSNSSVLFPISCCQPSVLKCTEAQRYTENCVSLTSAVIRPMLFSFLWTSVINGVSRIFFIVCVCVMFYLPGSRLRTTNNVSHESIFIIS